jgi:UPF0755 protein
LLLVIIGCGIGRLGYSVWQKNEALNEAAYIVIDKGTSSSQVAQQLFEAKIIRSPWLFRITARLCGLDKQLKAGEYEFQSAVSIYDVVQKLAKGEVIYRKLTLPEGLTTAQMLHLIDTHPFLTGTINTPVREGELLPETYTFARGTDKNNLIKRAKEAMSQAVNEAWERRASNLPLRNKNELLILASIIEKETGLEEEREMVASVFVNRLNKKMKLQTDPTVIYALTLGQKDLERPLTRHDLAIDSPYNTYMYAGLPPEPICNPGKASLQAAGNPAQTPYLYFVANGLGGHNFAVSLKEHNKNVRNWKNKP